MSTPVLFEERLHGDDLRFEGVAQNGGLPSDGRSAEEHDARQKAREHQTNQRKAQRVRAADHLFQKMRHGGEGDAKQHAGEHQKQRGRVIPGE